MLELIKKVFDIAQVIIGYYFGKKIGEQENEWLKLQSDINQKGKDILSKELERRERIRKQYETDPVTDPWKSPSRVPSKNSSNTNRNSKAKVR